MDNILDLTGMIIPLTFLKITQALREMRSGETMEIVGSDPVTKRDLFKILHSTSYELLGMDDGPGIYRIRLRKGPLPRA
ncbi:MAG: sulfurtransferase TusA family protein [Deltaproteobacteria bacterium]|nr:sulfurtransferase TusA family protein [Deltaproteobacteria bacterium]